MTQFTEIEITSEKNKAASQLSDRLKLHHTKFSFTLPNDETETIIEPCSEVDVSQQLIQRGSMGFGHSKSFTYFINSIKELKDNLRYDASINHWIKFYVFPTEANVKKYTSEEKIEKSTVCNLNRRTSTKLLQNIQSLAKLPKYKSKVKFLTGTTGVGKTTYLKYFTKTFKDRALKGDLILSRVKFRNVQNTIDDIPIESKTSTILVGQELESEIMDCLVRDIFDSYRRSSNTKMFPNGTRLKKLDKVINQLLGKIIDEKEWDDDKTNIFINKVSEDTSAIQNFMSFNDKATLISEASNQDFSFCIILDGFDAMNPEDIRLFGDRKEAIFFKCVSKILKNVFTKRDRRVRCLCEINKTYLIAARPITITQLEKTIERETDTGRLTLSPEIAQVIGTDIYPLLKARLQNKLKGNHYPGLAKKDFYEFAEKGIRYAVSLLYKKHKHLTSGRFIDLFNHNIREKVYFLTDVLDLLIYRIEQKYPLDKAKGLFPDDDQLTLKIFQRYLNDENLELKLDVYEIQRMLILNDRGYYKNYFVRNLEDKMSAETHIGQFDNIFRYYSNVHFQPEHKYAFHNDPILEKLWILYRLNEKGGQTVRSLRAWFKSNFKMAMCRNSSLKMLIRNGYILVKQKGDTLRITLSKKGKFLFRELIYLNLYLENTLLNSRIPIFISDFIKVPDSGNRRNWGRQSISNITIFLCYLKAVTDASILEEKTQLKKQLLDIINVGMIDSVHKSFVGMIGEGISNDDRNYFKKLNTELRRIKFEEQP